MSTHTITINVVARYPHGSMPQSGTAEITRTGDGSIEWFVDSFRACLVANGYSGALADRQQPEGAVPEVEQCHMMASSFDYLLKVRTADIQSYRRVLGEVISALPHVASTSTYVAMEAVKEVF